MIEIDLINTWCHDVNLKIKPGNVIAVYTDDGPIGICGQSCSITSPHTYIFLFNSEEDFRQSYTNNKIGRNGKNRKIRYTIVGDSGSEGQFKIYS
jgi:hypothetical protein